MDQIPITGLEELEKHVQRVLEAPDTPLNAKLFDEVELQLTGTLFACFRCVARSSDGREKLSRATWCSIVCGRELGQEAECSRFCVFTIMPFSASGALPSNNESTLRGVYSPLSLDLPITKANRPQMRTYRL